MNKVILTGRITADVELRQTQNGVSVAQFTLAVNRPYQKDKQQESDFISVVAWRATAEFVSRNFHKGDPMEVIGELRTRNYADRNYPDVKHYVTEVVADSVSFTLSKTNNNNSNNNNSSNGASSGLPDDFDMSGFEELGTGDLPF